MSTTTIGKKGFKKNAQTRQKRRFFTKKLTAISKTAIPKPKK